MVKSLIQGGDRDYMIYKGDLKKSNLLSQLDLEDVEMFDEYLEIILEYGYMSLFAESFPLAPVIVLIYNSIEIRSDLVKLATVMKRPSFVRKRNIGTWYYIMQFISCLSVFTNLFYTFYITYDDKDGQYGVTQLLDFFVLEHAVLLIFIIFRLAFSNKEKWVKLFLDRREYRLKKK
jgi:hypothetical protein